jgi:hypothetical protein
MYSMSGMDTLLVLGLAMLHNAGGNSAADLIYICAAKSEPKIEFELKTGPENYTLSKGKYTCGMRDDLAYKPAAVLAGYHRLIKAKGSCAKFMQSMIGTKDELISLKISPGIVHKTAQGDASIMYDVRDNTGKVIQQNTDNLICKVSQ